MMYGYRCAICSGVRPWYTSPERFWYTSRAALSLGGEVAAYRKDGCARATVTTSAPMWRATALMWRGIAAGSGTRHFFGVALPLGGRFTPQGREVGLVPEGGCGPEPVHGARRDGVPAPVE